MQTKMVGHLLRVCEVHEVGSRVYAPGFYIETGAKLNVL